MPSSLHQSELKADAATPRSLRARLLPWWPESIALGAYAAILAFAIPHHEPWADEAQAWQLARSLPLTTLFRTNIRYEGSPGLWYFLLWFMNKLHVSYLGLHWICGAIATASIALLVFCSPFPRYLKLALPFTYFLLFQYAVVARSYTLVPLLLFLAAAFWKKRPTWIPLILGLLANTSLHAAVIAGGLATIFYFDRTRDWKTGSAGRRRELVQGAFTILALFALAIWTAWPPRDMAISRVVDSHKTVWISAIVSMLWAVGHNFLLQFLFWAGIAVCLGAHRRLAYLLPVVFFAIFSGAVHFEWWHAGLVTPLAIAIVWMTWPESGNLRRWYDAVGCRALALMSICQILWAGYALNFDRNNSYSPDAATASFLQPFVRGGEKIAVTRLDGPPDTNDYQAVGILPYFDHSIFLNQAEPFWWWSDRNPTEDNFLAVLPSHPKIVLAELRQIRPGRPIDLQSEKAQLLIRSGYRPTHAFCGIMPIRLQPGPMNCHLIFQYSGSPD